MHDEFIPLQLKIIADYAQLIPGTLATVNELRRSAIKIGTTTGYNRQVMDVLAPAAAKLGFAPDSIVCASDVPAGRPEPWMALRSALELRTYQMAAIVKVGDTVPDIEEGLNVGMWTVGVALTGNEMGLTRQELAELPPAELEAQSELVHLHLAEAGAHYVIDGVWSLPQVIKAIDERLENGERP